MLLKLYVLRKEEKSWSRFGNLIDYSKTLNSLQSWYVNHIKIKANMVDHYLAKAALQQPLEQIWMEECHICIHDIVTSESITI